MKTLVRRSVVCGSVLACSAVAVLAPVASAQSATPPRVQDLSSGSALLPYLIGGILAIAAVALAAMPSRREHQD